MVSALPPLPTVLENESGSPASKLVRPVYPPPSPGARCPLREDGRLLELALLHLKNNIS